MRAGLPFWQSLLRGREEGTWGRVKQGLGDRGTWRQGGLEVWSVGVMKEFRITSATQEACSDTERLRDREREGQRDRGSAPCLYLL